MWHGSVHTLRLSICLTRYRLETKTHRDIRNLKRKTTQHGPTVLSVDWRSELGHDLGGRQERKIYRSIMQQHAMTRLNAASSLFDAERLLMSTNKDYFISYEFRRITTPKRFLDFLVHEFFYVKRERSWPEVVPKIFSFKVQVEFLTWSHPEVFFFSRFRSSSSLWSFLVIFLPPELALNWPWSRLQEFLKSTSGILQEYFRKNFRTGMTSGRLQGEFRTLKYFIFCSERPARKISFP